MDLRSVLITILLITASGMAVIQFIIWKRGQLRGKIYLFFLVGTTAFYCAGYGLELSGSTVEWVLFAYKIQYIGIAFMPAFMMLTAADYASSPVMKSLPLKLFLFTFSAATLVIVYTESSHALFHINLRMDTSGPFPVIAFDTGIWYKINLVYINTALLVSNYIYLRSWLSSSAINRGQSALMFIGSLIPWSAFIIYISGIMTWPIDLSPLSLGIVVIFLYRGIMIHGLADIVPIARDLVFDSMFDAAVVLDNTGRVVDCNRAGRDIFSDSGMRLTGRKISEIAVRYPELAEFIGRQCESCERAGDIRIDERIYNTRMIDIAGGKKGGPVGIVLVLREITDYVRMADKLRELASTDELTGIANRRFFIETAMRDIRRAKRSGLPVSIILFDIDHFKKVNDTYGHQAGDDVLRAVSAALVSTVRVTDLPGRYGGEEFVVCLPDINRKCAETAAERLRVKISELRVQCGSEIISVTISIGVCSVSDSDNDYDIESMLAKADHAMYAAKNSGRNRVSVFS